MLYIKREINESIDEYVMDENDILNLIERVFGNEFRVEVENKIGYKEEIRVLELEISDMEDEMNSMECKAEEMSECNIDLENYVLELEEKLKRQIEELEERLKKYEFISKED